MRRYYLKPSTITCRLFFILSFVYVLASAGCTSVQEDLYNNRNAEIKKRYLSYEKGTKELDKPVVFRDQFNECHYYGTPLAWALEQHDTALAIHLAQQGAVAIGYGNDDYDFQWEENQEESNNAIDGLYAMLCSARSVNDDEVKLFRMIVEKNMILCRYRSLFIRIIKNDKKAMNPEVRYEVARLFLQFLPKKEDSVDCIYYFQAYTGEDTCNYQAPILMRTILDRDQRMMDLLLGAGADREEAMNSYREYSASNARFAREFDKKQKLETVTPKLEEKNLTGGKISEIMKVLPGKLVWYSFPGNGARVHAVHMASDRLIRHANHDSGQNESTGYTSRERVELEPYGEITLIEGEEHTLSTRQISDSYSEKTVSFYYNRDLVLNATEDQIDKINSLIADEKLSHILLADTGRKVSGRITINSETQIISSDYKNSTKKQYVFNDAHVCTLAGIITK